jgi:photosystem II stability/assembly factor-like uncharacterized protein
VRRLAGLLALVALAGCGGGSDPPGGSGGEAAAIVDPEGEPPLVNSLEVEPGTGTLLVTTNRGFFRVAPGEDAERVRGTATARGRSAPVGGFLEILPVGPKALLGSGHPDVGGALPEFLGVLRSEDGGRTWSVLSRLGEADLHRMVEKHGRLYAFDAVLGVVLISADGGKTFDEKVAPPEPMVELEIDPGDPRRMLLASEETLFRTENGGERWRPLQRAQGTRLAWPEAGRLYRADGTGEVSVSADGGETFRPLGRVEGEPARLKAVDGDHLYVVVDDGTILETRDGARTWKAVYEA